MEHVGSGPRYRVYVLHEDGEYRMSGTIGGPWDWFDNALEVTKREEQRYPEEQFIITAFRGDVVYSTGKGV